MLAKKSQIFISYARADSEVALKLGKDLRAAGVKIWLDQLDIATGEHWDDAIDDALKRCGKFLIILSPKSVASKNVKDELSFALQKEKVIFPVLYKECEIPFRLSRIQYSNLTGDYEGGLKQLIQALTKRQRKTVRAQSFGG